MCETQPKAACQRGLRGSGKGMRSDSIHSPAGRGAGSCREPGAARKSVDLPSGEPSPRNIPLEPKKQQQPQHNDEKKQQKTDKQPDGEKCWNHVHMRLHKKGTSSGRVDRKNPARDCSRAWSEQLVAGPMRACCWRELFPLSSSVCRDLSARGNQDSMMMMMMMINGLLYVFFREA